MKRCHFYHRLWAALVALLPLTVQSVDGMGGFGGRGPHGSFGRGFDHHDRDHRFFHHRHFFFGIDFVAFGFPYWWYPDYAYPYYDYPGDYAYYDSAPAYDERFWQDLARKVQSELARRGYYHGQINGVIDSDSRQAIRAFQKAQGLPVTGLINPGVLRALKLPVPQIRSGPSENARGY
jgi:Putative peptidoglycan binding domain